MGSKKIIKNEQAVAQMQFTQWGCSRSLTWLRVRMMLPFLKCLVGRLWATACRDLTPDGSLVIGKKGKEAPCRSSDPQKRASRLRT